MNAHTHIQMRQYTWPNPFIYYCALPFSSLVLSPPLLLTRLMNCSKTLHNTAWKVERRLVKERGVPQLFTHLLHIRVDTSDEAVSLNSRRKSRRSDNNTENIQTRECLWCVAVLTLGRDVVIWSVVALKSERQSEKQTLSTQMSVKKVWTHKGMQDNGHICLLESKSKTCCSENIFQKQQSDLKWINHSNQLERKGSFGFQQI